MIIQLSSSQLSLTRDCAYGFFQESGLPGQLDFGYWQTRWESLMDELDIGAIFAYLSEEEVKGILGGVCVRCTMTGDLEAIEAFWYMMPGVRGSAGGIKLLKAFEDWARQRGATRIKMMHLYDLNAEMMKSIYTRMGYSPLEVAYSKNL